MVEIIDLNRCPECGGYLVIKTKEPDHWACMWEPCQHKFKGNHLENDLDVYPMGDIHLGQRGSDKVAFEHVWGRRLTPNPKARVIGTGDWLDSVLPSDKRFSIEAMDPELATLEKGRQWVKYRLRRNRHKVLGYHFGNHEWTIGSQTGEFCRSICEDAGVPYWGFKAHTRWHFENGKVLNTITLHGRVTFNSRIPMQEITRRQRSIDDRIVNYLSLQGEADLILMGHAHRLRVIPPRRATDPLLRYDGGGKLKARYPRDDTWYVVAGSFMRSYIPGVTTYGELYTYGALPIGCPKITIRDGVIKKVEEVLV